jgi:hypothetical protein
MSMQLSSANEGQRALEDLAEIEARQRAAQNKDGVDLTLIDWMLSLSPSERLATLQDAIDFFSPFVPDESDAHLR